MRFGEKQAFFLAFTAVFAALGAFVFWGAWSLDVVPIMPDAVTTHAPDWMARWWNSVLEGGKILPDDLKVFLGGPYFWQELQYLFGTYCAALAVVYYCRGRGLPRLAAYGAGLLLAFSGYWLTLFSAGHLGFFRWMTYGLFAFGLIDRGIRKDKMRHWLLLGATLAWASFNQQDVWFLFALFAAAYFVWAAIRERIVRWRGVGLAAIVFALIGLPNFRETVFGAMKNREEQIERGENITGEGDATQKRWEFVTNWSMPVEDTSEFLISRVHGDTSCPLVLSVNRSRGVKPYTGALGRPMKASRGNYRQHSLYVGWVTCLLALIGIYSGIRGRKGEVFFFTIAALVFYALSLGRHFAPAYRVVFALPFGDMIRCPVKWHHLTEFSLAILSAYGIGFIAEKMPRVKVVFIALVGLILVGAADLAGEAARFCAPIKVTRAVERGWSSRLSVLSRQQFADPNVAALVKAGQIVSVVTYLGNPNHFLVQVLEPFAPRKPVAVAPIPLVLGVLSALTSLAVLLAVVRMRK